MSTSRLSDLQHERSTCSFNIPEMTNLLYGGAERVKYLRHIRDIIQNDPICHNPYKFTKTRDERYTHALRIVKRLEELKKELNLKEEDYYLLDKNVNESLPTFLHNSVFVPCIQVQGSPEQQARWLPDAMSKKMMGAYAQTEMAHGSNVQGLQTTFTFIPETDEFDVHTPTLEATKWWPGNMGRTANHVVAFGRLIVHGKDLGIHSFLVPIRSYEDHKPLPGIEVGDIGAKFGSPANDNGYLRFNHVRIPRFNLLANFNQLDRDGKYTRPPHAKLAYTTMIRVRSGIVMASSMFLARASTIALRYSAQRRQFGKLKDGREQAILDYSIQRYRLIPLVAQSYALHFTGTEMMELYDDLQKKLKAGDVSTLPLVHATSAGLKSLTTRMTIRGIDTCRQCCGGQGYSKLSGLPDLFTEFLPMETAEGDNYLLTQQVGRYLLKIVQKVAGGETITGPLSYLSRGAALLEDRCTATSLTEFLSPQTLVTAFRHRVARLLFTTAMTMQKNIENGMKGYQAWNSVLVEIANLSAAHCMENMVVNFMRVMEKIREQKTSSTQLVPILERLFTLFCVHSIETELGEFLEDTYFNSQQITWIHSSTRTLIDTLRPDIIGLTDAYDFTDYDLDSAIGRYDGNVYQTLWEWAQHEPLNRTSVHPSWHESLKPMIQAKL